MNSKKIVITGGPGTGKTSIISELKRKSYVCFEEISRQTILKAREDGDEQLFLTQPLLFSERLLAGRIAQYNAASKYETPILFFDRGIPDIVAYMDYAAEDYPPSFEEACKQYRYDRVFVLAPWQEIFVSDNERYENFQQAEKIHQHLLNTYKKFGYDLLDVPFDSVENRTQFILNDLKG